MFNTYTRTSKHTLSMLYKPRHHRRVIWRGISGARGGIVCHTWELCEVYEAVNWQQLFRNENLVEHFRAAVVDPREPSCRIRDGVGQGEQSLHEGRYIFIKTSQSAKSLNSQSHGHFTNRFTTACTRGAT